MPSPARDPNWPAWYQPEDATPAAPIARPASPDKRPLPSWYTPEQPAVAAPQPAATGATQPAANDQRPLPQWYRPEQQQNWDAHDPAPADSWDKYDKRPAPSPDMEHPQTAGQIANDVGANFITGLLRTPGALIGLPHLIGHTVNWGKAQVYNALDAATGGMGGHTGAELDAQDPVMRALPSSEDVDRFVEHPPISEILNRPIYEDGQFLPSGKQARFYQPQSIGGRLVQAGVTGAASGGTNLPSAIKTGLAAMSAEGANEAFPDQPAIAAAAALLTHAGASGVGAAAKGSSGLVGDATRQVFRPTQQGELEAARVLRNVDNAKPGLASPTDTDLAGAASGVRAVTDDIGPGLPAHMAGANLRTGLQVRSDALRTARSEAGGAAYDAFRAQPPLPSAALEPLMQSPSFRKAVGAANAAALDEGLEPLTGHWDFNAAGDPVLKPNAAIPPDVLGRVKSWTASAASNAPAGSAEARTAGILDKRVGDFLDKHYPPSDDFQGYAAVRQAYADAGKPLGVFAHGPVSKTLETDRQFGQSSYRLADERVPDLFLRSKATRTDLNQLIAASGGDRNAALSALQDHLTGIAQSAVKADGTLDAMAFDKAMKPYQQSLGNIGMYFPELARKFASAKQAQATLDTLHAQRGLADAVSGGALRDADGAVTGASFDKWLRSNQRVLTKTQSPAGVMRLQSMARALQDARPGEVADALKSEIAPTLLGTATGGLEGGVLATLLHKSAKTMFGNLDQKRAAAFSTAMERAVTDPAYAQRLAATAAQQGRGLRPARALVRAVVATPIAVNSSTK